jgi:hypothetical protein
MDYAATRCVDLRGIARCGKVLALPGLDFCRRIGSAPGRRKKAMNHPQSLWITLWASFPTGVQVL